jgi:peroxiredoxin
MTAFVGAALLATSASAGNVTPELTVAEWTKGEISLEDFKGQVTVVVFFNDDSG